jgi:hypothetical protein
MSVVASGFTVQNNLETDGSVTVTSVQIQTPPAISTSVSGSQLTLSWSASWSGVAQLQAQTNAITVGLSTNWFTVPGSGSSNSFSTTINTNATVFYRLVAP